jgi:uncharacterized protein with PIN domain
MTPLPSSQQANVLPSKNMTNPIRINENPAANPICPHCEKPIRDLQCRKVESQFGVRYLYFCENCKKVLGVSHRKGFWMG